MSGIFRIPTVVLLALWFLHVAVPAQGAIYYVAKTGNDSNACTQAQPCLTIGRAASLATQPGDIVQVGPGTYGETVSITNSGSPSGKITFRGHDGRGCPTEAISDINHPTGLRAAPTVFLTQFNVAASHVRIECFSVTGAIAAVTTANRSDIDILWSNSIGAGGGVGIYLADNVLPYSSAPANIYVAHNYITRKGYGVLMHCRDNCVFEYNEIFDLRRSATSNEDGDYTRPMGNGITFYKNYFHGTSEANCQGCHIDCWQVHNVNCVDIASNITLDSNVCFNAHEKIIATNSCQTANTHFNWVVTNNILGHGPAGGGNPWCMILDHISDVVAYHNICIGGGIRVVGKNLTLRNNILLDMGGGIWETLSGGQVIASDNLIYEAGRTYSGSKWDGNIINQDPLFVGRSVNDYHLQAGSPAIDAGGNVGVTNDLDGTPRPQGTAPDIGPFEFGSASIIIGPPQPPTNLQTSIAH